MTNPPIAPEREPMLSDKEMDWLIPDDLAATNDSAESAYFNDGQESVRKWYEQKITEGTLRVVKKTGRSLEAFRDWCDQTFYLTDCCKRTVDDEARFCPGCGAQILPS